VILTWFLFLCPTFYCEARSYAVKESMSIKGGDNNMAKRKTSKSSSEVAVSKKDAMMYSQVLMGGAFLAVVFAALGYMGADIWLASTQWLLVSAVLALFGIYLKVLK
jgi:hypothetical protein